MCKISKNNFFLQNCCSGCFWGLALVFKGVRDKNRCDFLQYIPDLVEKGILLPLLRSPFLIKLQPFFYSHRRCLKNERKTKTKMKTKTKTKMKMKNKNSKNENKNINENESKNENEKQRWKWKQKWIVKLSMIVIRICRIQLWCPLF